MVRLRARDVRTGVVVALLGLVCLLAPASLSAQAIRGQVVDASSRSPLASAEVHAFDEEGTIAGQAMSDSTGTFVIYLDRGGYVELSATRIGYAPARWDRLRVEGRQMVEVTLDLTVDPLPIEGVTVTGQRRDPRHDATYEGLYARRSTARPAGPERVVVRGDPEFTGVVTVEDLLRWFPEPHTCVKYYVDGQERDGFSWGVTEISVDTLEGVEYFRDDMFAPLDYRGLSLFVDSWRPRARDRRFRPGVGQSCTVIAIWRQRAPGSPPG